nr:MAG TPA: DNA-directed RNA polymerase III subunit [Caudoviricetes sp.]
MPAIKFFKEKGVFSGFVLPTPTPPSQNETYLIVQVSKFSEKYKKTPFGA